MATMCTDVMLEAKSVVVNCAQSGCAVVSGQKVYDITSAELWGLDEPKVGVRNWFGYPNTALSSVGDACPAGSSGVLMSVADYNVLRSHVAGVTTSDVAALTGAVCLVWACAWLWKRAFRAVGANL